MPEEQENEDLRRIINLYGNGAIITFGAASTVGILIRSYLAGTLIVPPSVLRSVFSTTFTASFLYLNENRAALPEPQGYEPVPNDDVSSEDRSSEHSESTPSDLTESDNWSSSEDMEPTNLEANQIRTRATLEDPEDFDEDLYDIDV